MTYPDVLYSAHCPRVVDHNRIALVAKTHSFTITLVQESTGLEVVPHPGQLLDAVVDYSLAICLSIR